MVPEQIRTKIAGVTNIDPKSKRNRQELIRQFVSAGTPLIAERERHNRYDPHAVALWLERRGCLGKKRFHLGYVHSGLAKDVAALMDSGRKVNVTVVAVTGGTPAKPTRGVNIVITPL